MFEKRTQKESKINDSELEEITSYSKRKYATKIYIPEFKNIYNINQLGVISFVENDELFEVIEEYDLKKRFEDKKIKLYREKKNETV